MTTYLYFSTFLSKMLDLGFGYLLKFMCFLEFSTIILRLQDGVACSSWVNLDLFYYPQEVGESLPIIFLIEIFPDSSIILFLYNHF